jgi:hypothetical protein
MKLEINIRTSETCARTERRWTTTGMDRMNAEIDKKTLKLMSHVSLMAGLFSIAASIATWLSTKNHDRAHAERFGIFIGLWVPTLLILSQRLARFAERPQRGSSETIVQALVPSS